MKFCAELRVGALMRTGTCRKTLSTRSFLKKLVKENMGQNKELQAHVTEGDDKEKSKMQQNKYTY